MKTETQSQNKMILAYMMGGKRITALEALNLFGCLRLASRINDLRNQGFIIQKQMVKTESDKHVMQYWI
jgi:hypothetical protein